MDKPERPNSKSIARRDFLKAAGGLAGLTMIPWSKKTLTPRNGFSFAIIADSHIDPYIPERSRYLKNIWKSLTNSFDKQPAFVLHLGDTVETSLPEQYQEFMKCVPGEMKSRLHVVPGNHEVRWDESAMGLYRERFGKSQYSFDYDGIHFIALDPTQLLQEPGYLTNEHMDWLKRDLAVTGQQTPIVVYFHYPIGDDNFFMCNEDVLFQVLEGFNVRAVFTGHVHREQMWKQNGFTLFSLPAAKDGSLFFWAEKRTDRDDHVQLIISHAEADDNGYKTLKRLADILLTGPRPAIFEKPKYVQFQPKQAGSSYAKLTVGLDPGSVVSEVNCQFWPELRYAGKDKGQWIKLSPAGSRHPHVEWGTEIDISGKPSGQYRLQIRVKNDSNEWWDEFIRVKLPLNSSDSRVQWQQDLKSPVQAGLLKIPSTTFVIAATTDGKVRAFEPRQGIMQWEIKTGASIIGSPEADLDGKRVFIGSCDSKIYGLDSNTGELLWTFQAPGPILGSPLYAGGQEEDLFVSSGRSMLSIHPGNGQLKWESELGVFTAGKPDADEKAVYFGAGDGYVYALERAGGKTIWKHSTGQKERPYQTLIYSSWSSQTRKIPSQTGKPELLLVSTVSSAYALDRRTGREVWKLNGGFLYSAPLLLQDQQTVIFADESGKLFSVDYYSGKARWQVQTGQRIFNASPIAVGDRIYVSGVNGLLTGLQIQDGKIVDKYHFSTDYTYSTPAFVNDVIIQGGQDGILQAIKIR